MLMAVHLIWDSSCQMYNPTCATHPHPHPHPLPLPITGVSPQYWFGGKHLPQYSEVSPHTEYCLPVLACGVQFWIVLCDFDIKWCPIHLLRGVGCWELHSSRTVSQWCKLSYRYVDCHCAGWLHGVVASFWTFLAKSHSKKWPCNDRYARVTYPHWTRMSPTVQRRRVGRTKGSWRHELFQSIQSVFGWEAIISDRLVLSTVCSVLHL